MTTTDLTEREHSLLVAALSYRAEDFRKLAADCAANAAAYDALTPEQKAEYDKPKPETVNADGSRTIDIAPHPRAYARMAAIFNEQAEGADALRHKLAEAGMVALVAR